ncbi:MAG TPA: hypothetical protein VL633_05505 [Bacteroidota bacterium]|jgi:DNA-binding beta-propeller fold protein YncE|nr:hypothetical protein [Bacteroidota bacterium]
MMIRVLACTLGFLLTVCSVIAHPGSGIVVDKFGNVYFTDTGKGVWKIDARGNLTYLPSSRFHWLAIDAEGSFANSPRSFGQYFERVSDKDSTPTLITSSDFPLVVNNGNMYYADTRRREPKIVQRAPGGKESVVISDKSLEFVSGIAAGEDGSLYLTITNPGDTTVIRKITLDGTASIVASPLGKADKDAPFETTPSYCRGIGIDSSGIMYVAQTGSRRVLKITPQGNAESVLEEESPWTPTGVAIFKNEIYVLEWHDVEPALSEVRTAYIPRVRKIGVDGKATTIANVTR